MNAEEEVSQGGKSAELILRMGATNRGSVRKLPPSPGIETAAGALGGTHGPPSRQK